VTARPDAAPATRLMHRVRTLMRAEPATPLRTRATGAGERGRPTAYLLRLPVADGAELEQRRAALPWVRREHAGAIGPPAPARGDVNGRSTTASEESHAMSERAQDKPNKGQDEKTHEFVNDATGETRTETQRWFRAEGRDAGFRRVEDAEEEATEPAEGE
jgi:hypothetical protein